LLAEARRLIKDAGVLAEQGGFMLHFGEIGDYIPKSHADPGFWDKQARAELEENGYRTWDAKTGEPIDTPWADVPEDVREDIIDEYARELKSEELPREYVEYDNESSGWWKPSRC
jgi:hypothetical protein